MKVILYMAMSVNGIIADEKGSEDFLSDTNWELFVKEARKTKCFIMGGKTYKIYTKDSEYNLDKIKVKKIIVTHSGENYRDYFFETSPKKAVKRAKSFGIKKVLMVGGSRTSSAFMKQKLIDEIILNIEPAILGKGLGIFSSNSLYTKLKLLSITKKKDILQLRYKVIK